MRQLRKCLSFNQQFEELVVCLRGALGNPRTPSRNPWYPWHAFAEPLQLLACLHGTHWNPWHAFVEPLQLLEFLRGTLFHGNLPQFLSWKYRRSEKENPA